MATGGQANGPTSDDRRVATLRQNWRELRWQDQFLIISFIFACLSLLLGLYVFVGSWIKLALQAVMLAVICVILIRPSRAAFGAGAAVACVVAATAALVIILESSPSQANPLPSKRDMTVSTADGRVPAFRGHLHVSVSGGSVAGTTHKIGRLRVEVDGHVCNFTSVGPSESVQDRRYQARVKAADFPPGEVGTATLHVVRLASRGTVTCKPKPKPPPRTRQALTIRGTDTGTAFGVDLTVRAYVYRPESGDLIRSLVMKTTTTTCPFRRVLAGDTLQAGRYSAFVQEVSAIGGIDGYTKLEVDKLSGHHAGVCRRNPP